MSAAKYKLSNITVVIDCNGLQYDGKTEDVMPWNSMKDSWKSFGWEVSEIDGHDVTQCYNSLVKLTDKPHVVIGKTIKGKGISFMENNHTWHHGIMTREQESQGWEEVKTGEY